MLVLAPPPSSAPVPATLLFLFSPHQVYRVVRTFLLPSLSHASLPAMSSALNHRPLPPSTPLEHITEMRCGGLLSH